MKCHLARSRTGPCDKILWRSWWNPSKRLALCRSGPCEKILRKSCLNHPQDVLTVRSWRWSAVVLAWQVFRDVQRKFLYGDLVRSSNAEAPSLTIFWNSVRCPSMRFWYEVLISRHSVDSSSQTNNVSGNCSVATVALTSYPPHCLGGLLLVFFPTLRCGVFVFLAPSAAASSASSASSSSASSASSQHHQHNIIIHTTSSSTTWSSTQHHQHNIINTTPSTQHHQHNIINTTPSTHHHQHNMEHLHKGPRKSGDEWWLWAPPRFACQAQHLEHLHKGPRKSGDEWWLWAPPRFAWQAQRLEHLRFVLRGRRSTWSTSGSSADLGAPPARFAWQAQHLEHLRFVLRGRRSTWTTFIEVRGSPATSDDFGRSLVLRGRRSTWNLSGVVLHGRRSTWNTFIEVCGSPATSDDFGRHLLLRGRRSTWSISISFCVAAAALGAPS